MTEGGLESTGAVGRSPPRLDGVGKVTGRALYLDDIHFSGQLWGRTVRSPVAHGRIRSVRFDEAFDWTGITRVTAEDIPGENVVHLIADDQMNDVLAGDVLRGDARDARPVERLVEPHASDPTVGDGRADGAAPELTGEVNVVQVECSAGDFVDAVEARRRTSDHPHRLEPTL